MKTTVSLKYFVSYCRFPFYCCFLPNFIEITLIKQLNCNKTTTLIKQL